MMRTQFAIVLSSSSSRSRGTRNFSSIPSSPSLSLIIKRRWENQTVSSLCCAFLGGYIAHEYIDYQKWNEHSYKVDRMINEHHKRVEELSDRFWLYVKGKIEDS